MKIDKFLQKHGIQENPFADEEAQTDPVFKDHCISSTRHPSWDKIFGNPLQPSTSVVFGEKGAGKTAMRLQIVRHLVEFNGRHPDQQVFIIQYDDFNPYLDRFCGRYGSRPERGLPRFKLWDHMDGILSLAVNRVVDFQLGNRGLEETLPGKESEPAKEVGTAPELDHSAARDVLLLAACYDDSLTDTGMARWQKLKAKLKFSTWRSEWERWLGIFVTLVVLIVTFAGGNWQSWLQHPWVYVAVAAGWLPFVGKWLHRWWLASKIVHHVKVGKRDQSTLHSMLMQFGYQDLAGFPFPSHARSDDRYELLLKLQALLRKWNYTGVIVLVDRIDEPDLIGGSAERMRSLLWPMLDNKFLKQPGFGVKVLAPAELMHFVEREDSAFYQRSRLDKQNMIRSLEWTGEALYDVATARIQACAIDGKQVSLQDFFDPSINERRLIETFRQLRVPRHLFQFIYRLFMSHCNTYTEHEPVWKISRETFEATLALYRRDMEAFDRGLKAG